MAEFEKMELESADLVADRIAQLKQLMPEIVNENGIDFDMLRLFLGDEIDEGNERYAFTWPGKTDAIRQSQTPTSATLRPSPEESVNWSETENLYIEGDNLEVLKLLQHSYHGRVKLIYIDPPYNTGKDFVYKDKFGDTIANYREQSGLGGQSNADTSGRYHSDWCSMMYPRLRLARELLKDDGLIFISIDGHEYTNLIYICNEIFGEPNYVGTVVWKNATDNNPTNVAIEHEYIVMYAKQKARIEPVWKSRASAVRQALIEIGKELCETYSDDTLLQEAYTTWFKENKSQLWPLDRYKYIDRGGVYTGSQSVHNPGKMGYRYDVIHPITGKPCKMPLMGYRFPKETMDKMLEEGRILFGTDENKIIELKLYARDYQEKLSSVYELDGRTGAYDLRGLFPEVDKLFSNPKPVSLLSQLISYVVHDGDLFLDFFSGSATSAHSILQLNAEDNETRRFIHVQIPELCPVESSAYKAGYKYITDIGKERIRRAGAKITAQIEEASQQLRLGEEPKPIPDVGFRVLKLDESGIERPKPGELLLDVVKPDRSDEDIIFEMMLKWGLELTLPIEKVDAAGYPCYSVAYSELVCCLAPGLNMQVLDAIAEMEPRRVLMLDRNLDDTTKLNAVQAFKRVEEKTGREVELRTV